MGVLELILLVLLAIYIPLELMLLTKLSNYRLVNGAMDRGE